MRWCRAGRLCTTVTPAPRRQRGRDRVEGGRQPVEELGRPRRRVRTSGGASRSTSGCDGVDEDAGVARRGLDLRGDRRGSARSPSSRPRPRTRRPAGGRSAFTPVASASPELRDAGRAGRRARSCRARPARPRTRPGCRRTSTRAGPGPSSAGRLAERDAGTDRQAAAEPLGQRDDVRARAPVGAGARTSPRSARCRSAPRRGRAARRRRGADPPAPRGSRPGGTTTPPSPRIGSRMTAAVSASTAAPSASTSPYGTKSTPPGSGSNGSRLAG